MKTIKFLTLVTLFMGLTSCSSDDSTPVLGVTSKTISNLHAPQSGGQGQGPISGSFTKFNFATGKTTTSDTDWDIAFRGTSIIVNGGASLGTTDEPNRTGQAAAYIANGTMASITDVDSSLFVQDSNTGYAITTGNGNGWYTYAGPPTHLITPIPGKILVFKTRDGKYAKVEILSYYENAPANPDITIHATPYYTFNYVYQPNTNVTTF
ncbi:HmuY family protein [Flavivirga spongiicola]|uniref:HmuY family protein n=1 Tax=Flavivirga spongiicola TaxID=421621 RepID=A0ABU7XTQ8_9FLAO|nr:HmuY family protein [Flavivirga sp. MEBiC05379]MDO5979160.1 HmuY family protein [Flavivirga sp. MEBiC05379]